MQRISSFIRYIGRGGFAFLLLMVPMGISAQPWNPQIIWEREGAGDSSRYGGTIFGLGDQNDDGFDDFGVEAWGWGGPGQENEARTEFFYGGNPPDLVPFRIFNSQQFSGQTYSATTSLGDVNGDSYIDWQVSTDSIPGSMYAFHIYFGGLGPESPPQLIWLLPYSLYFEAIGDFNSDGFDDLGAYNGAFQILFGSPFIDSEVDWMKSQCSPILQSGDIDGNGASDLVEIGFISDSLWIYLGGSTADTLRDMGVRGDFGIRNVAVDLNGDHFADIATTMFEDEFPVVDIRFGSNQLSQEPNYSLRVPCGFGSIDQVIGVGDINADGYGDLGLASEFCSGNSWGIASVWLGYSWLNPDPVFTFEGRSAPWDLIGIREIAGIGDVNGDSVDDFAIGAFNGDFDGFRGRAIIIAGNPDLQVHAAEASPQLVEELQLSIFPNPANALATLFIELPAFASEVSITLYNTLGQQAYQNLERNVHGQIRHSIALTDLSSGLYFAQVTAGNLQQTAKLLVQK